MPSECKAQIQTALHELKNKMGNKQTKTKKSGKSSSSSSSGVGKDDASSASGSNSNFRRQSSRASPPRGISGILGSSDYTEAFRNHLKALDEEKEDDEATNVTRLDFVVQARKLYDALPDQATPTAADDRTGVTLCNDIHKAFLGSQRKVALENTKLRDELSKQAAAVAADKKFSSGEQRAQLRDVTCKALKDAELLLDGHHKTFLRKREKAKPAKATACLLSIL